MYQQRSHTPAPLDGHSSVRTTRQTAANTNDQIFAIRNPGNTTLIVERVYLHVITRNTSGAATVDIGVAADGDTTSDNLIDGASIAGSNTIYNNITDVGSNGKSRQLIAAGQYVTATVASGDANGLVAGLKVNFRSMDGGS